MLGRLKDKYILPQKRDQYRTLISKDNRDAQDGGVSSKHFFVLNRIKGFKEIQDEQPIQTGINN